MKLGCFYISERLLLVKADIRKAARPAGGKDYSRSCCHVLSAAY
jgi:hypothetical protein